jgi:hypothetical protein
MDLKILKNTPSWDWPDDASDTILSVMGAKDAKPTDRLFAVESAGDSVVVDERLVAKLLEILQDRDEAEDLRGRAAISLGPVLELADMEGFEDPEANPITEETFHRIQETLHKTHSDVSLPKEVRRRSLEASVRSIETWHEAAVRKAYSSDDESWKLTAVFCMQYVRGFDREIVEALKNDNPDIHCEAVCAAGNWQIAAAWPHITGLLKPKTTDKPLLLAAIEAAANIRPREAEEVLLPLLETDDEEIEEAVNDALSLSGDSWMEDDEEEDSEDDENDED